MKAKEIMMNNWVKSPIGKIVQLDEFHFNQIIGNKDNCYFPVSLTEEWLLNFGFEKVEFDGVTTYGNKLIYIEKEYKGGFYKLIEGKKIELDYVHKLQNLHFILTDKELNKNT